MVGDVTSPGPQGPVPSPVEGPVPPVLSQVEGSSVEGGSAEAASPQRREEEHLGVGWLVAGRFLLVVVSLVIIFTRQVGRSPWAVLGEPPALLLVGCLPLGLLYLLFLPRVRSRVGFARTQIFVDVAIVILLVYMTGGVDSNLIFLNFGPILAASSLLGLTAGVLCASVSAIGVALVTLAHFLAFLGRSSGLPLVTPAWAPTFPQTSLATPLFLLFEPAPGLVAQAVSFYLVAILSGTLSARLKRSRILNEEILEKLIEGVLTISRDGAVVFLNQRARELLGVGPDEAVTGRPWRGIVPNRLRTLLTPIVEGLLAVGRKGPPEGPPAGPVWDSSFRTARPASPERSRRKRSRGGGAYGRFETTLAADPGIPVEVASSPLTDDRGQLRGVTVIFIDLRERKRMEAALRQAERLEALNQAAAGIAHEIRNPIASIRASAQELLSHLAQSDVHRDARSGTGTGVEPGDGPVEGPVPPVPSGVEGSAVEGPVPSAVEGFPAAVPLTGDSLDGRLLRVLMLESDRLNHIVSDFLAYARLRQPSLARVSLSETLTDVVLLLSKQAGPGHQVRWDCPADLAVQADREQLTQVLLNLGLNGLEAMPEGGTLRFVARGPSPGTDDSLVIAVSDEGQGLPAEEAQRIFEPFFTTKAQGTGMGLAVSKRIVEAHGGRITASANTRGDRGGQALGTRFRVELPVADPGPSGE